MRLNLGCSTDLRGPAWINVDIAPLAVIHEVATDGHYEFQQADLALPWPWEDSSIDEIYAADIFEHIGDCQHVGLQICEQCYGKPGVGYSPARDGRGGGSTGCMLCSYSPCMCVKRHWSGRIHVINESWRVLKPGGILRMECPDAAKGAGQWQDPTHVTPWTPNGLQYFCVDLDPPLKAWERFRQDYGVLAKFKLLDVSVSKYVDVIGVRNGPHISCEVYKFSAVLEVVK